MYEDGRFFTFTESWPDHAADTHPRPDKAMLRAFDADKRRAPLYQYQASNLLWHPTDLEDPTDLADLWRSGGPPFGVPLTADDKEALMGYSYRYTEELDEAMQLGAEDEECSMAQPSREEVETRRRHAIGLGWHLPSVTLLLTLLLAQILPAEGVASWAPKQEYLAAGELIMVPVWLIHPSGQQTIRSHQEFGSWITWVTEKA